MRKRFRRPCFEVLENRALLASTLGDEFAVNSTTAGEQFLPAVARAADGEYAVAWTGNGQDGDGLGVFLQRFAADGSFVGGERQVNVTSSGDQLFPALAFGPDRSLVVAWESSNQDGDGAGVFARSFDAAGTPIGGEFPVNTATEGDQLRPQIAIASDGTRLIAWSGRGTGGDPSDIYARRFASDGSAIGGEFSVTDAAGGQFFVTTAAAGQFIIVWESNGEDGDGLDVFGQLVGTDGGLLGEPFAVNVESAGDQAFPAVAADTAGGFVVVWDSGTADGHRIRGRRFDAGGEPLADEFPVTTTPSDWTRIPHVVHGEGQDFVVVWSELDRDGDGEGVFGRAFTGNGDPQGPVFAANTTTAGDQSFPALAMDDADNFVVVWQSYGQDGDRDGIFGQRFFVNDPPVVDLNGNGQSGTGFSTTFVPGSPATQIVSAAMTVTDIDSAHLISATATLQAAADGGSEGLVVDTAGTAITAVYDTAFQQLVLLGEDTARHYQQVLRTLSYSNNAVAPTRGQRTVSVVVNDGLDASPAAEAIVLVEDSNRPPRVDLNGSEVGVDFLVDFVEDQGGVPLAAADAVVTDTDSLELESAILTLVNARDAGEEFLDADTTGTAISAIYDAAASRLVLSGRDSAANYQRAIRSAVYENSSQDPDPDPRLVEVIVRDEFAWSPAASTTVNIMPVNDPPQVDLNGPADGSDWEVTFSYDAVRVPVVDPGLLVDDPDSTVLASATARLSGAWDGDSESLSVDASGTVIQASFDPQTGRLLLVGPDTPEHFRQALATLSYGNTAARPTPGWRSIEVQLHDQDASGPTAWSFVEIARRGGRITGEVYADINDNGRRDPFEIGLPNVPVRLHGTDPHTTTTDATGHYEFDDLPAGTYTIEEVHPTAFIDGRETQGQPALGQPLQDHFADIDLAVGMAAQGYNFGERGLRADFITKQLLLASSPGPGQLVASFTTRGSDWYRFQPQTTGILTISTAGEGTDFVVEVYADSMLPAAIQPGVSEFQLPVQQNESYVLHVAAAVPAALPPLRVDLSQGAPVSEPENPLDDPRDVNQDGRVTPLDVLVLINLLNRSLDAPAPAPDLLRCDIDRDGTLAPLDALLVILYLNGNLPRAGRGEGESLPLAATAEVSPTARIFGGLGSTDVQLLEEPFADNLIACPFAGDWLVAR